MGPKKSGSFWTDGCWQRLVKFGLFLLHSRPRTPEVQFDWEGGLGRISANGNLNSVKAVSSILDGVHHNTLLPFEIQGRPRVGRKGQCHLVHMKQLHAVWRETTILFVPLRLGALGTVYKEFH